MAIPTPGFTSANVATEAGISPPWNSNNAAVLALLADGALPYNSADLAGRSGADYIPAAVAWADIAADDDGSGVGMSNYVYTVDQTITGINPAITLEISIPAFNVNCSGSQPSVYGYFDIYKNATFVTQLSHNKATSGSSTVAKSTTLSVSSGDVLAFGVYCEVYTGLLGSSGGGGGTVSVINQSSSNTVLDTFAFTMSATAIGG